MSESIEESLKSIVAEQLSVDPDLIKPETKFMDLGADSLDIVELIMSMEEAYEIEIPDEEAEAITTFADAVNYVKKMKEA